MDMYSGYVGKMLIIRPIMPIKITKMDTASIRAVSIPERRDIEAEAD